MKILEPDYLAFLRKQSCILCPAIQVEAHHLVNRGTGSHKQNDWVAVPICRTDHHAIHSQGLAKTISERGVTIARLVEAAVMLVVEYHQKKDRRVEAI